MSKQAILDKIAEVSFKDEETGDELVYVGDVEFILTAHEGGWISVEDRLPEPDETVLLYTAGDHSYPDREIKRGYYSTTYDPVWCLMSGFTLDDVTHWMPLPAPPEEGLNG